MGLGRGGRGARVDLVDFLLGGKESGADDPGVDGLGTLGLRKHQPDNGERLDGVVPRNVVEDDAGEGLKEGEHAEDDPVGEPLDVILGLRGLECLEREVGGNEEADEVGQEASGNVEEDELWGGGAEASKTSQQENRRKGAPSVSKSRYAPKLVFCAACIVVRPTKAVESNASCVLVLQVPSGKRQSQTSNLASVALWMTRLPTSRSRRCIRPRSVKAVRALHSIKTYESEDTEGTNSSVSLGNRHGLLELLQSGVPRELLVVGKRERRERILSVRRNDTNLQEVPADAVRRCDLPPCRSVIGV